MTQRVSTDMLTYNALDTACTWQCVNGFFEEIDQGYRETYEHTIELYEPLMYMMVRGMRVDRENLERTKTDIEKKLADLAQQITERCGRFVNPNSHKDVQTYFYVEKGITPYTKYNKKTGKSSITTDDKALQRIARGTAAKKGFYEAKLMQEYRKLWKLKGTYLEINFDADSRLRCSYNPRGTKFGRLSSSKTVFETGMNMQNLPEAFLGFLVADDGMVLIELDKAKAEWVIVAYDSGDANMINAIESGVDVHAYTASRMFGVPIELIEAEDKILGHTTDPEIIFKKRQQMPWLKPYMSGWLPRNMSMRQCGKKSNHGLNYGETPKMFALINEIIEKEAKVIVDMYHRTYPGIKKWYGRIQDKLGTDRTLVNCFGRKCRFLDRWGDELFKAAYSFNPQSTVGEVINRGLIKIYKSPEEDLREWEILRQVHDSIDSQIPLSVGNKGIARGVLAAVNHLDPELEAGGRTFKIKTDMKLGFRRDKMKSIPISTDVDELAGAIGKAIDELKAA